MRPRISIHGGPDTATKLGLSLQRNDWLGVDQGSMGHSPHYLANYFEGKIVINRIHGVLW